MAIFDEQPALTYRLGDRLVTQALYRSEVAAQADDLFNQFPPALQRQLKDQLRHGDEPGPKKRLTETLPQFLAFVKTAIDDGWIDELVGRMEREAS